MFKTLLLAVAVALLAVGCSDKPHDYGRERPPVGELDSRDRGLQSKDVIAATDQLAQDLLALPELNRSKDQWTVVVDRVENHTTDPGFNYDIFIERLRVNLAKYGHGRVALIENKAKYHELQSRELEQERDDFGQGGAARPGQKGTQPDFSLWGRVDELSNRGTSYYQAEFHLTDLRSRIEVWTNAYEVKVAR